MSKISNNSAKPPPILYPKNWKDHELLDAGNFRKLERFGKITTDRPEPSADWPKSFSRERWAAADLYFYEEKGQKGHWKAKIEKDQWTISYPFEDEKELKLTLEKTAFKHLGVFPEQAVNWEYIDRHCRRIIQNGSECNVLNLFAYTGAASVTAGLAGANVTHVDTVKQVIQWGKENAKLNQVESIRWIIEDARKFVKRSLRKKEKYQGIIMDPPAFGYAPKGKVWKLEKDLPELLANVLQLMDRKNSFFIMNTYSPSFDHQKIKDLIKDNKSFPKSHELKTLGLKSRSGKILPLGDLLRFYS